MKATNISKIALREFSITVELAEIIGQYVVDRYCLEDITYTDLLQLIDEALALN
jgi:hypothetical protein